MTYDPSVVVTGEFGLVIRRKALVERRISLHHLCAAMEVSEPLDVHLLAASLKTANP
jgi:hypothetical protein